MPPGAARDHTTVSERPVSHGSAHRQVYALCLLAAAPALAISGTTAYSAYVDPVWPLVTAGQRQTGRTLPYLAARWGQTALAITAVLLNRVDPASNWRGLRNIAVAALFAALTLAVTQKCAISRERLGIGPPRASTARGRAQTISVGATAGSPR